MKRKGNAETLIVFPIVFVFGWDKEMKVDVHTFQVETEILHNSSLLTPDRQDHLVIEKISDEIYIWKRANFVF